MESKAKERKKCNFGIIEMGSLVLESSVDEGLPYVGSRFVGSDEKMNNNLLINLRIRIKQKHIHPWQQKSVRGIWNCIGETIKSLNQNLDHNSAQK